jgi:hypothetical protein
MHGKEEKCMQHFLWKLGSKRPLEHQDIDNRMLNLDLNPLNADLNPICHLLALLGAHPIFHISRIRVKQVGCTGLNCTHVAQERDQRQAVVNTVMNPNLT